MFFFVCAVSPAVNCDEEDENGQRKLKRGVLPKRATQIMKSWLFQHIAVSYLLANINLLT